MTFIQVPDTVMRLRLTLSSLILASFLFSLSPGTATCGEKPIARGGGIQISVDEFVRRYEMTPGFGHERQGDAAVSRLDLAYSMIAEKLLAREAVRRGLDKDPALREAVATITRLLARDELYRKEISAKVKVTPAEISRGMDRARHPLLLCFVRTNDPRGAEEFRRKLPDGADLQTVRLDPSLRAVRDTVRLVWGEGHPAMEDAAYRMAPGQISPVIQVENRFYVVSLLRVLTTPVEDLPGGSPLRETVTRRLRERHETALVADFLGRTLRGKSGYALPRTMKLFCDALAVAFGDGTTDSTVALTPSRANRLYRECAPFLGDSLLVAGKVFWPVREIIDRFLQMGFSMPGGDLNRIPARVNMELRRIVEQEYLEAEALRRRLDTIPSVRRDIEIWAQSFLAERVRGELWGSTIVDEGEIHDFIAGRETPADVPLVQIRELKTRTTVEMQGALDELKRGVRFQEVVTRWSSDTAAHALGGLTPFFPATERPPVGPMAGRMKIGERAGPLAIPGGLCYFEVVGKKDAMAPTDSTSAEKLGWARDQVRSQKAGKKMTFLLARLAKSEGFSLDRNRLESLKLNTVPMMVFKLLGFGGRIPAMPGVTPEVEWLGARTEGEAVP
jgi:parvulin-like peptidyl-prolyl isomerase